MFGGCDTFKFSSPKLLPFEISEGLKNLGVGLLSILASLVNRGSRVFLFFSSLALLSLESVPGSPASKNSACP